MSNPIVSFDEEAVKSELRELVRKTIEETINAMLDEEADQLVGAGPYERTDERAAYRAGHYERGFTTTSGQVTLKMPKLKGMRFATAVIERYKRRETSVEEAIIEMRLAGVSTRRIEDVGEVLWGAGVSAGTVSNLNDKAFKAVDEWRCRPLTCEYPYVYVDGIYLKHSWGGSYENVAVMVAIGVNEDGYREVIGCAEGFTESAECWRDFLSWLKSRGLRGVRMFTGDKAAGMVGSIAEVFPDAKYQRCTVHLYRNVLAKVPKSKRPQAAAMLKAIHAMESREAAAAKAEAVADDLESTRLKEAAKVVRGGHAETLAYREMPREHWRRIRTSNAIERLNREIRRRTRVVGTFPDGKSALMLAAARLKHVADSEWRSRRYLDVSPLKEQSLNRADDFKRTRKGHRPASMPLNETHFLSYKPCLARKMGQGNAIQLFVVLFLSADNHCTNGSTAADKQQGNPQCKVACITGLRKLIGCSRFGTGRFFLKSSNRIFDSLCHLVYFGLLRNIFTTDNSLDSSFHTGEILVVILV